MTSRFVKYCFSVLLVLASLTGAGAQAAAFAEPDSNVAETGNPFTIHLRVTGVQEAPEHADLSGWNVWVPEQNVIRQTDWTPGGQGFNKDLTVVFFDEDTLTLPPLNIRLKNGAAIATNALDITVVATPSPDDLVDMSDIKDIRREPANWMDYMPWILGIAGLVLLVVLASWLIGRTGKKGSVSSRSVELPPHELALKKLAVLEQKQLWQKGQVKAFCAEITHILREYLEKRFQIPALESTSEQILTLLRAAELPETLNAEIENVLLQADLAKFAKSIPPENFHQEAWRVSRELIHTTVPVVPEPTDTPPSN